MKPFRIIFVAVLMVFTAIGLSVARADSSPATRPAVMVTIENFRFEPSELSVPAGTTVTWKNVDDVPHTATSKDEPQTFDSGPLDTDDSFSFTFGKPGTYAYYCKVHPHMTGVITVK
jgi:plastocyanin